MNFKLFLESYEQSMLIDIFRILNPNLSYNWSLINYSNDQLRADINNIYPGTVHILGHLNTLSYPNMKKFILQLIDQIEKTSPETADQLHFFLKINDTWESMAEIFNFLNTFIIVTLHPRIPFGSAIPHFNPDEDIESNLLIINYSLKDIKHFIEKWKKALRFYTDTKLKVDKYYNPHKIEELESLKEIYLKNTFHLIMQVLKEMTSDTNLLERIQSLLNNILEKA